MKNSNNKTLSTLNSPLSTLTYRERVETAYAEVNRRGGEFMRSVCAFGALLDEVAAFLGESRGGDRKSNSAAADFDTNGLQNWLAENCPEVNYKTAMGYKALAGKAAKMIGGGTQAIAALQGRDTVAAPGTGEVIDVDAEIIEKREALFAEVDSRRKLEQAYFAFMAEEGRDGYPPAEGRPRSGCSSRGARPSRAAKPLPKLSQRDEAKAIWNGVMVALSKSSVRDAIPLLGAKETQVCHDGLMDLLSLLKKHLKEF